MSEEIVDINTWRQLVLNKSLEFGFNPDDLKATTVPGYLTSLHIESVKNAVNMNISGIRERFLSTAVKQDSIVKGIADRNIQISSAIPSYCKILLILNISSIAEYFKDEEMESLIISKDNPIYIDNTPFSLYYDIELKLNDKDEFLSAEYIQLDGKYNNPLDINNILNKPISTVHTVLGDSNDDSRNVAIGLVLDVRQYIREYAELRYNQNIKIEIQTVNFHNQLADFTVKYKPSDYAKENECYYLSKKYSFAKEDVTEEAIFYRMEGTTTVQLFNRINGNFQPKINSLLEVEVLSTSGLSGNFNYSGNDITLELDSSLISYKAVIIEQPSGGKDTPTIEEMRKEGIRISSTRGVITNEEDLKKYYTENLGVYKIEKIKHDFFNLSFAVVAGLKNETENFYYPTNTIDLYHFPDDDSYLDDAENYMLVDPDKIISYEHGKGYNVSKTAEDVEMTAYKLPYILVYSKSTNTTSVYERSFDRTYLVNRAEVDKSLPYSIIMNRFRLTKNANTSHTISSYITTTRDIESDLPLLGFLDDDNIFRDTGELVVRASFYNRGIFIGYKDMDVTNFNNTDKYYTVELTDFCGMAPYNDGVELYLKDMTGEDTIQKEVPINNIFIDFNIYIKSNDGLYRTAVENGFNDLQDYRKTNIYKSEEVTLFNNITHINNIQITTAVEDGVGCYVFKNIPVVEYAAYILYPNIIDERIRYELDKLRTIYNITPQNHQVCLRFANTCGFSKRYKIGYNIGAALNQLYSALKVSLKIKKNTDIDKVELARYINTLIMSVDFLNGDFLHLGNIMEKVKEKYTQIEFINYVTINDLPSVYNYIYLDSSETAAESTPELISIEHVYDSDYGFIPNIEIELL